MSSLRTATIRLAAANPRLRPYLLPILREAAEEKDAEGAKLQKEAIKASNEAIRASREARDPEDGPAEGDGGQSGFGPDEEADMNERARDLHEEASKAREKAEEYFRKKGDEKKALEHQTKKESHTKAMAKHEKWRKAWQEIYDKEDAE
jgi:hypothetical protein